MIQNSVRAVATAAAVAATVVAAIPWPEQTGNAGFGEEGVLGPDGWSPRPTQDPLPLERALFKRQVMSDLPRTCGYVDGDEGVYILLILITLPFYCAKRDAETSGALIFCIVLLVTEFVANSPFNHHR